VFCCPDKDGSGFAKAQEKNQGKRFDDESTSSVSLMRGRVMSLVPMAFIGSIPLGMLINAGFRGCKAREILKYRAWYGVLPFGTFGALEAT